MKKPKKICVYVDGVDFQHEIGIAPGGNTIYKSIEDLKENNECWESCGIVRCYITFDKWEVEQNLFKGKTRKVKFDEIDLPLEELGAKENHLKYLEKKLDKLKHKIIDLKVDIKRRKKNVTK